MKNIITLALSSTFLCMSTLVWSSSWDLNKANQGISYSNNPFDHKIYMVRCVAYANVHRDGKEYNADKVIMYCNRGEGKYMPYNTQQTCYLEKEFGDISIGLMEKDFTGAGAQGDCEVILG